MVKWVWAFFASFFALMIEILGCSLGLIFPGIFFLCFYLAVSYSKVAGAIFGAGTCIVSEIVLGRSTTALPLLVPLILYADFWRLSAERRYLITQAISGALIGFFYYLYCYLTENMSFSFIHILRNPYFILSLFATTIISAIGLPIMLRILDFTSTKIDLNTARINDAVRGSSI